MPDLFRGRPIRMGEGMTASPVVHFVAFRGDEWWSAVRIWGRPTFIHRGWDRQAKGEIEEGDMVIFARGTEADEPSRWNYPDVDEPRLD